MSGADQATSRKQNAPDGRIQRWLLVSAAAMLLLAARDARSSLSVQAVRAGVCVGEVLTFSGKLINDPAGISPTSLLGVEDPVSRMSAQITPGPDGSFSYSTVRSALAEGLFAFRFVCREGESVTTEYVVVTVSNCAGVQWPRFQVPLEDSEISLGDQGSSLDEETESLACQFIPEKSPGLTAASPPGAREFFVQSFLESIPEVATRIYEGVTSDLRRSIPKMAIYGAATIACGVGAAFTAGGSCVPLATMVLSDITWNSVEIIIDEVPGDLTEADRQEIKRWSKLGYTTFTTVIGLGAEGGVIDASETVRSWGELAWENRPTITPVERFDDGTLKAFTVTGTLADGTAVGFSVHRVMLDASDARPQNTVYLDTKIALTSGDNMLCTTISGEYNGHVFGMPDATRKNYFIVLSADGQNLHIPIQDIQSVERQIPRIIQIAGNEVTIDKGSRNQIREQAVFITYHEYEDFIMHTWESAPTGIVRVTEVGEESSKGLILANYQHGPIRVGNNFR